MFQCSKKPVKHHRRECLKQFPLKPSLTRQCTSCWSYALFVGCFQPVTFPENLHGVAKLSHQQEAWRNSAGVVPDFGKEGRSCTVCSVHLVIFVQLCGRTWEPWTNPATQVWTCIFCGIEPTTLIFGQIPFWTTDQRLPLRNGSWLARLL